MTKYSAIIRSVRYNGSLAELSAIYSQIRDDSGEGMRTFPIAAVFQDGLDYQVAHISYNGRIWPGCTYSPIATPLYDNRDECVSAGIFETLGRMIAKPFGC